MLGYNRDMLKILCGHQEGGSGLLREECFEYFE